MPPFLQRGPHIQMAAAGKCFGDRQRSGQRPGEFLKDVMRMRRASGGVHLFGRCIIWHTSITEEPRGSHSLIRVRKVGARRLSGSRLRALFTLGVKTQGGRGRGDIKRDALWVNQGGMWLEKDSRLPAHRQRCCSGGRRRGAHMSLRAADIIFFVRLRVDNGFCPPPLPRSDFIQYAPTYADPGISSQLAVKILVLLKTYGACSTVSIQNHAVASVRFFWLF